MEDGTALRLASWLKLLLQSSGSLQDAPDAHRTSTWSGERPLPQQGHALTWAAAFGNALAGNYRAEGISTCTPVGMKCERFACHHLQSVLQCRGCDHFRSAPFTHFIFQLRAAVDTRAAHAEGGLNPARRPPPPRFLIKKKSMGGALMRSWGGLRARGANKKNEAAAFTDFL